MGKKAEVHTKFCPLNTEYGNIPKWKIFLNIFQKTSSSVVFHSIKHPPSNKNRDWIILSQYFLMKKEEQF